MSKAKGKAKAKSNREMVRKNKRDVAKRPRYRAGYSDGSGLEYITLNDKAVAVTAWGCSCCKPEPKEEHFAKAIAIAEALNESGAKL